MSSDVGSSVSQADAAKDGIGGACDNCPLNRNTTQTDADNDGLGDICDDDLDGETAGPDDGSGSGEGSGTEDGALPGRTCGLMGSGCAPTGLAPLLMVLGLFALRFVHARKFNG